MCLTASPISATSSLSLRLDPTGREFPSPLVTVFDVPIASMRASGMGNVALTFFFGHVSHDISDLYDTFAFSALGPNRA